MALINSDVVPFTGGAYELEQALRFNDDDSAYLSWTPSSAGNRKTWTWSGWVKRGNLGINVALFGAYTSSTTNSEIFFNSNDYLHYWSEGGGTILAYTRTDMLFRDTSAWYHIVVAYDSTETTQADRLKIYINGSSVSYTDVSGAIGLNEDSYINDNTRTHSLGYSANNATYFDGYMSEVNFIDGQALDATSFGETGTYGEWKPKAYSGTYGTNGFYLPFKQDYTVEGFSTTLYTGTGANQYIGGTGFQPDFVWIKERTSTSGHRLFDAVRGTGQVLQSDATTAELDRPADHSSFDSDGFTVGASNATNENGQDYVAWSWDMGGSTVSNTNGSITSSVRANPTYGQSIVSYTGNATSASTVGHGLTQSPDVVIVKARDRAWAWKVYHSSLGVSSLLNLDDTSAAAASDGYFDTTAPTSSVVTIDGTGGYGGSNASGENYIMYCFHSVSGYSKFGSYTGNGSSSGPTITLGFKPAFVIAKRTDSAISWVMMDNARDPSNPVYHRLNPDTSNSEGTNVDLCDFTDTGFTITTSDGIINASSGTYIYMAFADNREFAYWLDQSGNNNDWTSNNLTESDISVDSPTNNFATWNPLDNAGLTLSEGNLRSNGGTSTTWIAARCNMALPSSGKWYYETYAVSGTRFLLGIIEANKPNTSYIGSTSYGYGYFLPYGWKYNNSSYDTSYGTAGTTGDIMSVAWDADNGELEFYLNGISQGVAWTGLTGEYSFAISHKENSVAVTNFGQDSSFAGNKTAQGNTDSNSIGDFYYTPPSGYLALCTANLSDPAVIPSEHFNTVLWTGNNSQPRSITGVGFQSDLVWTKVRNGTYSHTLFDVIRSPDSALFSDTTGVEQEPYQHGILDSFDSDGFTVNSGSSSNVVVNESGKNYVAWNWKAGGSGVSNTDGSITSTVSANQDAGFSIVSYTGNGTTTGESVGHGLSQRPDMVIVKNRSSAAGWDVLFPDVMTSGQYMALNTTAAIANSANSGWGGSLPDSTQVYVGGSSWTNTSGDNYVMYCFHSVDGFSKVGSYTGNGSTDGTFVYTGFRPAFVMIKASSFSGSYWCIYDTERETYNVIDSLLFPNDSLAETTNSLYSLDILSNGFKAKANNNTHNTSGATYIYIAFAETPFSVGGGIAR